MDFQKKTALVTMEPGKRLSREQCESTFSGTRYTVLEFEPRDDTAGASPDS